VARAREAAGVAELGQDRDRGDLADAVVGLKRPAAGLAAGQRPQLPIERSKLLVDGVDHRQGDVDLAAG